VFGAQGMRPLAPLVVRIHEVSFEGVKAVGYLRLTGLNGESPVMSRVFAPRGNRTPSPLIESIVSAAEAHELDR
jgi:hypothetical protein